MNLRQYILPAAASLGIYAGMLYLLNPKPAQQVVATKAVEVPLSKHSKIELANAELLVENYGARVDGLTLKEYNYNILDSKDFYTDITFDGVDTPSASDLWTETSPSKLVWSNKTWQIEQSFEFMDYSLTRNITIKNLTSAAQQIKLSANISREKPKGTEAYLFYGENNTNHYYDAKITRDNYSGWAGMNDLLFVTAFSANSERLNIQGDANRAVISTSSEFTVKANETVTRTVSMYIGPKNPNMPTELQGTVNYGFFSLITKPLSTLFRKLNNHIGSVAITLVVFALLVKFASLPLSLRGQRVMQGMKAIQPHINALKSQYKDSPKILQLRMLELYKQHGINPLSMILPLILQLVMFFPVYRLFNILPELKGQAFWGGVKDLTAPDASSITNLFGLLPYDKIDTFLNIGFWPCLMAASFYLQPENNSGETKYIFPILMLVVGSTMPVSIVIYWTISNLLNIAQAKLLPVKTH